MRLSILWILSPILLIGCMPKGADEIGDLYGRWKLETVDSPTSIVYSDTLFLAFQGEVYQYQPNWDYDWGTYRKTDDSLFLHPLQYEKYAFLEMGIKIKNPREIALFKLDALSNKRMQLSRNDTIWYFRKYLE